MYTTTHIHTYYQVVIGVPSGHFGVSWCSQDTRELTFCSPSSPFSHEQVPFFFPNSFKTLQSLLIHYRALSLAFVARFARASYICSLFAPQFFLYHKRFITNSRELTFSSPSLPFLQGQITFISCLLLSFSSALSTL